MYPQKCYAGHYTRSFEINYYAPFVFSTSSSHLFSSYRLLIITFLHASKISGRAGTVLKLCRYSVVWIWSICARTSSYFVLDNIQIVVDHSIYFGLLFCNCILDLPWISSRLCSTIWQIFFHVYYIHFYWLTCISCRKYLLWFYLQNDCPKCLDSSFRLLVFTNFDTSTQRVSSFYEINLPS